jgi:hypothetical protein
VKFIKFRIRGSVGKGKIMTLKEVNYEVERLENELNKLLGDKELLEALVDPKSTDYTKIMVDGGKHTNILELYILKKDLLKWQDLDKRIKQIQEQMKNDLEWIDNELKILKKYDRVEQLIVFYKEIDEKNYTWSQIASKVHYSKDYCRKIYQRYKNKRDF